MQFSFKSVNSDLQIGADFQQLVSPSLDCKLVKNRGKNCVEYSKLYPIFFL